MPQENPGVWGITTEIGLLPYPRVRLKTEERERVFHQVFHAQHRRLICGEEACEFNAALVWFLSSNETLPPPSILPTLRLPPDRRYSEPRTFPIPEPDEVPYDLDKTWVAKGRARLAGLSPED